MFCCFFFKQKTAYEMRISDWSSDVCSSDLCDHGRGRLCLLAGAANAEALEPILSAQSTTAVIAMANAAGAFAVARSEERSVGKECVSTCRSRWSPYP